MIEIRHAEDSPDALRRAYDSFYSERTTEHHHSYYRWILRQLQPRPGTRLLDLCCGSAVLAAEARRRGVAAVGVRLTLASTGAVFPMVTLPATAVPLSVPSSGVTVQVTMSLPTKAPDNVAEVPTSTPSTVQA